MSKEFQISLDGQVLAAPDFSQTQAVVEQQDTTPYLEQDPAAVQGIIAIGAVAALGVIYAGMEYRHRRSKQFNSNPE